MVLFVFFFKQKTAYEMRISDWSSDVCSSDLMWASSSLAVLDRAQTELEEVFSKAPAPVTAAEKREWEARVLETRQRVDTAAEVLASMEADHKGGWLHAVHSRSAVRVRDMCAKNRGVYINLGQHLAHMDYMIQLYARQAYTRDYICVFAFNT